MRRVLAVISLLLFSAAVVVVVAAGNSKSDSYKVRAIFDHAGYLIEGEDVRIAGVRVGRVSSVEVTPDNKAAVVLDIREPAYRDFRVDARCNIRPQSLIGEKYVDCSPTQPRSSSEPLPAALPRIENGKNAGQRVLANSNTGTAVDLDLINNILRRPYAERFSLILNELGTGLAGRANDLSETIRRADPALRDIDEFLALLASQNRELRQLVRDSDSVVGPLARHRRDLSAFVTDAGSVAQATVERRADLEKTIQRLPRFLNELRPTMVRLGAFAQQTTPLIKDLHVAAPQINTLTHEVKPFSSAAIPALKTLGDTAEASIPAVIESRATVRDLRRLAHDARPLGKTLSQLLVSFKNTGGIGHAMEFFVHQATAINGFDEFGHYLRAALVLSTCATYATQEQTECLAALSRDPIKGLPKPKNTRTKFSGGSAAITGQVADGYARAAPRFKESLKTTTGNGAISESADELMLDYLFGSEQ